MYFTPNCPIKVSPRKRCKRAEKKYILGVYAFVLSVSVSVCVLCSVHMNEATSGRGTNWNNVCGRHSAQTTHTHIYIVEWTANNHVLFGRLDELYYISIVPLNAFPLPFSLFSFFSDDYIHHPCSEFNSISHVHCIDSIRIMSVWCCLRMVMVFGVIVTMVVVVNNIIVLVDVVVVKSTIVVGE